MGVAVAYCRVSTLKQQEALEDHQKQWTEIFKEQDYQFANCGIFYKKNGEKEPKRGLYVDEGISAKEYKKYRKAFQKMIEDAMSGMFKQILVEDTTRFARSVEDGMKIIKDLRANGVDVFFRKEGIHSTDVSQDLFLSIYFTIAESEIKTDSNRLKWKQDKLHREGKWTSRAPFGYNVKKCELSINEEEQPIVDLIYYLYTEKLLGMRMIANYLNHRGFRTRKNQLWKSTEIKYILSNKMYIGDIVNHKTESVDITRGTTRKIPEDEQIVVHNEALRIIEDEVWDKKERILKQRNEKLKDRKGHSTKHILSGILYCQNCGAVFIRENVKTKKYTDETGKKANKKYAWICQGHNHYGDIKCKGRYPLMEDELMDFIKNELKKEKERNSEEYLALYTENKRLERDKIDIQKLKEEHEDINMQMFELRRERNKKLIGEATFEQQVKLLNKRLGEVRALENEYNALDIDIQRAEMRFNERRKLLKSLNLNKITNVDLKNLFSQIKVMGYYEDGYKYIYLYFSYNILDNTKTKLSEENGFFIENFEHFKTEKIRKSTRTRYFDNEEDDKWKPKLE